MDCKKCWARVRTEGDGLCGHEVGLIGEYGNQCPLITRVYTYYEGKVHSIEVKETAKVIKALETNRAFNCSTYLEKNKVCVTPLEAIKEYKNRLLTRIGMHKDGLERAEGELFRINIELSNEQWRMERVANESIPKTS